jgi:hypothetical protein
MRASRLPPTERPTMQGSRLSTVAHPPSIHVSIASRSIMACVVRSTSSVLVRFTHSLALADAPVSLDPS